MRSLLIIGCFVSFMLSTRADVAYTYEDDGKTYVATLSNANESISDEAIAVLDANEVNRFVVRGSHVLVADKGISYTGDVHVEDTEGASSVRLSADGALGVSPGSIYAKLKLVTVNGATVRKRIVFDCASDWGKGTGLSCWAGYTVFKEKVSFNNGNFTIYPYVNSQVVFEGGLEGSGYPYLREANGGRIVFEKTPVNLAKTFSMIAPTVKDGTGFSCHLTFAVAGNQMPALGHSDHRLKACDLRTTVDWAFDNASQVTRFGRDSVWDLCGTYQRIGHLDAEHSGGVMTVITNSNAKTAMLYLNQTSDSAPLVVFGGDLSVSFSGAKTTTFSHEMTATGEIVVEEGNLVFGNGGKWPAEKVTVENGASISISSGETFNHETELVLNGTGDFSIAAGEDGSVVTQKVGFLTLDGVSKARGFYEMGDGVLEVLYSARCEVTDGTLTVAEGGQLCLDASVLCDPFDSITLGDGAKLEILTSDYFVKNAGLSMSIGEGGLLTLGDGIELYAASVMVKGVALAPGRYTASNLDWLEGGGAIYVPYGEIAGTDVQWSDGGANTLMTTPENWALEGVNLHDGSVRAMFGDFGTEATVAGTLFLNGLSFASSGAFAVNASDAGALLRLASGGVAVSEGGPYKISSPLCIEGDQEWQIDEKLELSGALSSDPLARYSIRKKGAEELLVSGGGDFSGDVYLDEGRIRLAGGAIFGSGTGRIVVAPERTLCLNGATVNKAILIDNNDSSDWNNHTITVWEGVSLVSGKVTFGNRNFDVYAWRGSHLTFAGGVEDENASNAGYFRLRAGNGGRLTFAGCPVKTVRAVAFHAESWDADGLAGILEFAVAGNSIPALGTDNGKEDFRLNRCVLKTSVDWAFDNPAQTMRTGYASIWDLCGTKQRVGHLDTKIVDGQSPMVITNSCETAAKLYVNMTSDSTPWVDFAGNLSVDFSGGKTTTINRAMSAKGDLIVNTGVMSFAEGGSWRNAANVEVGGSAKIVVGVPGVFHKTANMTLASEASLEIASGVTVRVASLMVGGVEMPPNDYQFGSGTLAVGPVAMRIIIR